MWRCWYPSPRRAEIDARLRRSKNSFAAQSRTKNHKVMDYCDIDFGRKLISFDFWRGTKVDFKQIGVFLSTGP